MADAAWIGQAITGASALLAALGTGILNSLNNKRIERNKRVWGIEDEQVKSRRMREEQKYQACNKIMQAAGDSQIIQYRLQTEEQDVIEVLNIEAYRSRVRPAVYENFHLLSEEVRWLAVQLDLGISSIEYFEQAGESPDTQTQEAVAVYYQMIEKIQELYQEQ